MATILQVVPALDSGGVERGTLEVARALVANGHRSLVLSAGGRLVEQLEREGSTHIALPIGRKRLSTFRYISDLRALWRDAGVDLVHVRSRMPAWVVWRAWQGHPPDARPRFVTTVHGFYSPGWYSSVMTRGERVICVSESVRAYVEHHYPKVPASRLTVIHRGVDPTEFPRHYRPTDTWSRQFWASLEAAPNTRRLIVLPARLTRWKGAEDFIQIIAALRDRHPDVLGLVVGGHAPNKARYVQQLRALIDRQRLTNHLQLLGHRNDLREILAVSDIVLSLSREPEAFGRTTLEALSLGRTVVGYDHGGVGEQLRLCSGGFVVPPTNVDQVIALLHRLLSASVQRPAVDPIPSVLRLETMQRRTLELYASLLAEPPARR